MAEQNQNSDEDKRVTSLMGRVFRDAFDKALNGSLDRKLSLEERRRRIFTECIASGERMRHLLQNVRSVTQPPPVFRRVELVMPKWDDLLGAVKVVVDRVFANDASNADAALVKSMIPRSLEVCATYLKGKRHGESMELTPVIDRIKWRLKTAANFNVPFAVFKDDPIDESTKTDDLKSIEMYCSTNGTQDDSKWREDAERLLVGTANAVNAIIADIRKKKHSRSDFAVSQSDAAKILGALECPVSSRTIRNWESGKATPDGYTVEKRCSIEAFTAWAKVYAARENSKLSAKKALAYREDKMY